MMDLAEVIADARGEAAVLRRAGSAGQADYVESLCTKVATAAEDYLKRISLADARLKSGLNERTLKRRHRELMDCGLAGFNERREMWFRACAVPQRASVGQQRERGRRAVA
jgi:hypothetical protein